MPSRFHRIAVEGRGRGDTPADVAERLRYNAAREQVQRERAERYPTLTADNVDEVLAWQERRLRELVA